MATQCQSTTPTKAFLPHQRVTTEGKAMKTSSGQEILKGFNVRDISADYDEPRFDVLFVHDDGKCRYSNDVFGSEQEAISYAKTCNANTADSECWDYYQHSSTSNDWKLIQHIEAKAA
ncbi:hypothetical protein ACPRR8_24030 [Enterobacter hormaechei]|uniref:hypothetical protein n=3 Tax=Enterobacter TaxID=547 RepID=UPI003C7395A9